MFSLLTSKLNFEPHKIYKIPLGTYFCVFFNAFPRWKKIICFFWETETISLIYTWKSVAFRISKEEKNLFSNFNKQELFCALHNFCIFFLFALQTFFMHIFSIIIITNYFNTFQKCSIDDGIHLGEAHSMFKKPTPFFFSHSTVKDFLSTSGSQKRPSIFFFLSYRVNLRKIKMFFLVENTSQRIFETLPNCTLSRWLRMLPLEMIMIILIWMTKRKVGKISDYICANVKRLSPKGHI